MSDLDNAMIYGLPPRIVERLRAEGAAEAWDEGYAAGFSNAMRRMSDEPKAPTSPNPYRGEPA